MIFGVENSVPFNQHSWAAQHSGSHVCVVVFVFVLGESQSLPLHCLPVPPLRLISLHHPSAARLTQPGCSAFTLRSRGLVLSLEYLTLQEHSGCVNKSTRASFLKISASFGGLAFILKRLSFVSRVCLHKFLFLSAGN